jgi:hypothetical protein
LRAHLILEPTFEASRVALERGRDSRV